MDSHFSRAVVRWGTSQGRHLGRRHAALPCTAAAAQHSVHWQAWSSKYSPHGRIGSFCTDAASVSTPVAEHAWLHGTLRDSGPAAAAKEAFAKYGVYRGNEVAWRGVTEQLLEKGHLTTMSIAELKDLVRVLAEDAMLTMTSFWERMTQELEESHESKILPRFVDGKWVLPEKAYLDDLIELAGLYCKIGYWSETVFLGTIEAVRQDMAVHTLEPRDLTNLLDIYSKAGSSSQSITRKTRQLFTEAQDRLLDDAHSFEVDDVISVVESLARFGVQDNVILKHLGKERLHSEMTSSPIELPAEKVAAICSSYGEIGFRHDTVFKHVSLSILAESERLQRARALGTASSVKTFFSASDVALIADAMLNLKMHTGNTPWCKWQDNYEELLEVVERRLEEEMDVMTARPLAAASFVLGRARLGNEDLHKAMYERMMNILENDMEDLANPPQRQLARFMHGLAMMGPNRKKEYLDTQWLMHWMCHNAHSFLLSDLIAVNRHLVCLGCFEKDYLMEFVPWLTERTGDMSKIDVQEVSQTYNDAGFTDDDLGRHFFWSLGRHYQKLHIRGQGGRRAQYRRVG